MGRRLRRRALRWFARWVERSSDERLQRVMAGRLGDRILNTVKRAMEQRFDASRAGGLEAVIELWITGRRKGRSENWQVAIDDGRCRATEELREDPDLIVEIDCVPFLKLVTGNASGRKLFLEGDLTLQGDLMLANRLPRLFRRPRG